MTTKDFDNVIGADDFKEARALCDGAGKDTTTCMALYDEVQKLDKDLFCGMSPIKLKVDVNRLSIEKKSAIKAIGRTIEKIPGMTYVEKKIATTIRRGEEKKRESAEKIDARRAEKVESCTALPIGNRIDKRII